MPRTKSEPTKKTSVKSKVNAKAVADVPLEEEDNIRAKRFEALIRKIRGATEDNPRGKHYSVRGVAQALGVSTAMLTYINQGQQGISDSMMGKLARFLGWTPEQVKIYIDFGIEPSADKVDDVCALIRLYSLQDCTRVLAAVSQRLTEIERMLRQ